ncbi:MAG: flagellar biosynthesis protein FlhB [Desulfovibrionaceae bacterium]|nr:flagellar biosynthesis protein FlhB [Desulfovibrionaceae bacterium]
MASDPSKTENATPKRIKKARDEGNVPKSQEMPKAISVLAGLFILTMWIGFMGNEIMRLMRHYFTHWPTEDFNDALFAQMRLELSLSLAKMVLPVLFTVGLFIFVLLRVQVGKLWTTKVFKPKLSKFNPLSGLKRMFLSSQTFIRLGKSLLLALCIGVAPTIVIKNEMQHFPDLYYMDAAGIAIYILKLAAKVALYAFWPMLVISLIDLWYTRWKYKEDLKMSKDEVKDERKQMEGDERVKAQMKQKMLKMSAQRMFAQVPKADVVITNPTHIAVALKYDASEAPAPVVVAMGVDRVAERIKEIARENKVPIRENKPLAQALYKQTEVGDMIPAELFQAVALILAQIWKTRNPGRTTKP